MSYLSRRRLGGLETARRREPTLKDYWHSPQHLYTSTRPARHSHSYTHSLVLPSIASLTDWESCSYPSFFNVKQRMLFQYPVLDKTWTRSLSKIILDSFRRSRFGLQDYWTSPQRAYPIGVATRNSRRYFTVLPGNTGISDVDSTIKPGYFFSSPKLVWKFRWQKLRDEYLSRRFLRD